MSEAPEIVSVPLAPPAGPAGGGLVAVVAKPAVTSATVWISGTLIALNSIPEILPEVAPVLSPSLVRWLTAIAAVVVLYRRIHNNTVIR